MTLVNPCVFNLSTVIMRWSIIKAIDQIIPAVSHPLINQNPKHP